MIKKYISASQLSMFLECPMKWYNKYVLKRTPTINYKEYIIYGSALHRVLEKNYRQKIESKIDLPIEELLIYWSETFQEECNEEKRKPSENNVKSLLKAGEDTLRKYMIEIAPGNQPIAVEQQFEIKSDKYNITIRGAIDLITDDGRVIDFKTSGKVAGYIGLIDEKGKMYHIDETKKAKGFTTFVAEDGVSVELKSNKSVFLNKKGETLEDIGANKGIIGMFDKDGLFKSFGNTNATGPRTYTQAYVDNMLQMTMYSIAYRKLYDKNEKSVTLEILKRLKGGPKIQIIDSNRTGYDIKVLSQLMDKMNNVVNSGNFYPNLTNCQNCEMKDFCKKIPDEDIHEEEKPEDVIEIDLDGIDIDKI